MPNPWDRLDKEPSRAYLSFLAYRDMGYRRTVLEAYRQISGKLEANYSSGTFLKQYTDFRWKERAAAWDRYAETANQKTELAVAAAVRYDVAQERIKAVKIDTELGDLYKQRARTLLNWPLADKVVKKQVRAASGELIDTETHFEAVDARTLAAAARIGQIGTEIVWAALDQAAAMEAGMPVESGLSDREMERAVSEATRLWEDWQADQQRKRAESRPMLMPPTESEAGQEVAG